MSPQPSERSRALRDERRAAKVCVACGGKRDARHIQNCRACADRATQRQLAYLKRKGRKR